MRRKIRSPFTRIYRDDNRLHGYPDPRTEQFDRFHYEMYAIYSRMV